MTGRILVIDEEFPYPLNTGKRIRTFNLVRELTRFYAVEYLAFGDTESESARHLQEAGIVTHAVAAPDRRKQGAGFYGRLLANLVSSRPYIVTSHFRQEFADRLAELTRQYEYDLIIVEWTPYAQYIEHLTHVRSIVVAHNIESTIWQRYYQNESNPLKRWYIGLQANKVRKFEHACFGWASGATAVTRTEADEIASHGVPFQPEVIDNGVDVDYFAPMDSEVDTNRLVFTGSMDWRPNQDATIWFARRIMPILRDNRPKLTAVFVGRNPPPAVQALAGVEGIEITGTVPDVRGYIAGAALYIVPLRIGGGSRLKILEAMAMKKPVLSTTVGAEGLEVRPGREIALADEPQAFAEAVLALLDAPDRRLRLAEEGYKLVHRRYRWDQLAERFHHYIEQVREA